MFGKNMKMNFLGGKTDKSASKATIQQKQSLEFRKSLQQQQENDRFVDSGNNQSQRAQSLFSSLSHPPSMASSKSLPADQDINSKNPDEGVLPRPATPQKKEKPISSQAPSPSSQTVTSLPVNTGKPKLLRSSVNENQVSKISERFSRSLEENKDLKQRLDAKRQEAEHIEKEYFEHLKTIRAVDEDYCTITDRLNILHTKINQFLMSMKGRVADPATATQAFVNLNGWDRIEPAIQHLVKKKEISVQVTITQLAEKFIVEQITKSVYNAPIYIGLPQNDAFVEVSQFMEGYSNWAVRLRQQLCTIVANLIKEPSEDNPIYKAIEAAKAELVARMLNTLSAVYSPSVHKEIEMRLKSYVDQAATISMAMHSLTDVVRPMGFIEGRDKVDPERIDLRFGKAAKNDTIQIVVCPPFVYIQNGALNILTKGKVIAF